MSDHVVILVPTGRVVDDAWEAAWRASADAVIRAAIEQFESELFADSRRAATAGIPGPTRPSQES